MELEHLLETVHGFDGVLDLAPDEASGAPEIAWGDHFLYWSADGAVPERVQPYATVVTKDYPDDDRSDLDPPDRWRVNVHVGRARFAELTGEDTRHISDRWDFAVADVMLPHPVYGALGWVSVVNPGERTSATVLALLRDAHERARARAERREPEPDPGT
ncbi:DUF6194 family protein [Nakamurella leprariae]|uniref:DUF6194 domain-containing protein n=1 Tax=Nakamurella leprariae TaxID=2803911 RepID=A0A939BVN0_9ACTN|nr:DUF6194 family protein [Nakamurella leprariae]MBM9466688.1 hypothetical protein [Nakamurella leprariae]